MKEGLRERLWAICSRYLAGLPEKHHGIEHVRRVEDNFCRFAWHNRVLPEAWLSPEDLEALWVISILHDIGRCLSDDHARASAKLFRKLCEKELSDLPAQDLIHYVIANHSMGVTDQGKVLGLGDDIKEICLGIFVVLDHMDALGSPGIYRTICHYGKKLPLVREDTKARAQALLENPHKCTRDMTFVKEVSIAEHLIFNIGQTDYILNPVQRFMPGATLDEIARRLNRQTFFARDLMSAEDLMNPR